MTNEGIAIWDPVSGTYAYYNNGSSLNGGSRYIAPYQGVFIQTTAATNFTFGQANRTVTQTPTLLKAAPEDISLTVSRKDGSLKDELLEKWKKPLK